MAVFGKTSAEISKSFLEHMPESLAKDKFFEELSFDVKCVCKCIDNDFKYALEGSWESVSKAQADLLSWLNKWTSNKLDTFENKGTLDGKSDEMRELTTEAESCTVSETLAQHDIPREKENDALSSTFVSSINDQISSEAGVKAVEGRITPQNAELCSSEIPSDENDRKAHNQDAPEIDFEKTYQLSSSTDVIIEEQSEAVDIVTENDGTSESESKTDLQGEKVPIENEIYMDIKLSKKPDDKMFDDPDFPVALILTSEDQPCVGVVQLSIEKDNTNKSSTVKFPEEFAENPQERVRLRRRRYEENTPNKFFCTLCSYRTKRQSHMKVHSRIHERVCKIYSCPNCNFSTVRLCNLQKHARTHKVLDLACALCPYTTDRENLLLRHQRNMHSKKKIEELKEKQQFQCLKCSYMTTSAKYFQRHMVVHQKEEKEGKSKSLNFQCEHCSYKSPSRWNYIRHLANIHRDERPYMCNTCGLSFKRSDTLVQHRTIHGHTEHLQSFECSLCPKFYRSANLLREHLLTHSEERSYLCEICGAAFKRRAVQRKHVLEVHGENKNHICPMCGKKFSSNFLLKRHISVHPTRRRVLPTPELNSSTNPIGSEQGAPTSSDVQLIIVQPDIPPSDIILNQDSSILVDDNTLAVPITLVSDQRDASPQQYLSFSFIN